MKYIGICFKGLEKFVSKLVNGIVIEKGRVSFDKLDDLKYFSEVYEYIIEFKFKTLEDLIKKLKSVNVGVKGSLIVECKRDGTHEFRSLDVARGFGEILFEKGFKINLKEPENKIFVDVIENKCFVGILKVFNNCKREYRVKINNQGISGCLAYTLLKIGGLKKNETLVDPFCKDGTICIEAFLNGFKNVYGLDFNKNNIMSSKLNSKIANVKIEFIEGDVSWLGTKFKVKEIRIITSLPFSRVNKSLLNVYKEFFKEAKNVAKGKIVVVSGNDQFFDYCKDFKVEKIDFMVGGMKYYLGILS